MLRTTLALIALLLVCTACKDSTGSTGTGTKQPGVKPGQNGGISFGGWHRRDGDDSISRRSMAAGPGQPSIRWEYDFTAELPAERTASSNLFTTEPLIDLNGNIYIHVSWLSGMPLSYDFDPNDPDYELKTILSEYSAFRLRNSYLFCVAPDGSLKWKIKFQGGGLTGIAIAPAGYLALCIGTEYVPDKQLDKFLNSIKSRANYSELHDSGQLRDELLAKLKTISAIHIVDGTGRIVKSIERKDHTLTGALVTSSNQVVTSVTDIPDKWPTSFGSGYTPPASFLAALDLNGREIWRNEGLDLCRPITELPNGIILCHSVVLDGAQKLVGIDTTGTQVWDFKLPTGSTFSFVVDESRDRILIFRKHRTKVESNKLYGISYDGKPVGKFPMAKPFYDTPMILSNGSLITKDNRDIYQSGYDPQGQPADDQLSCFTSTGDAVWSKNYSFVHSVMAMVTDANDVTYSTYAEASYVVEPDVPCGIFAVDASGEVSWRMDLADNENHIELAMGPDGTLYCTTNTKLYAIGPGA